MNKIVIEENCSSQIKTNTTNIALLVDEAVTPPSFEGKNVLTLKVPSGEQSKSREMKAKLEDEMFANGFGRDTTLVAIGGGVVTDLGGFIAATYCRGIELILVPTTLLAMVDASIGGKTGINVPAGKNLLGAFYLPKAILIDPLYLQTLPEKQWLSGLAEVIKHALIRDSQLFTLLEDGISTKDSKAIIEKSVKIKQDVVASDPKESALRQILNFGHTFGHGIEAASGFTITHGEAVCIGMLAENQLGMRLGLTPPEVYQRTYKLLKEYKYELKIPPSATKEKILGAMKFDKKAKEGKPSCVFLKEVGKVHDFDGKYALPIEEKQIHETLDWLLHEEF